MPYSALAIANEFLRRAHAENHVLTHMHLQKLVYIAHGWNLAVNKDELVDELYEAWEFGPVSRRLYDALKHYGKSPISRMIRWGDDTTFEFDDAGVATVELEAKVTVLINQIWDTFKSFEAFQLSALTHRQGTPWSDTFVHGQNRTIANNAIQSHFSELADRP